MNLLGDSVLISVVLIFVLRLVDVALGTIRAIMVIRGMRIWATLIGFMEVTVWVVAISQVISNMDSIWKVLAYSGGFAAGTLAGMWLEEHMALGDVAVYVVSAEKGAELARKVRRALYGATELPAYGHAGPVSMLSVVTPRKRLGPLLKLVEEIDAGAFVTVNDKRHVARGYGRVAK